MFAKALARLVQPSPGRAHDHLFTPYAPEGAPAHVLSALFHHYAGAPPDEPPPPQHRHYRALVLELIHAHGGHKPPAERLRAAYVACFEQDEAFRAQLKLWRADAAFCARLSAVRRDVIAGLVANDNAEAERRAHFARWRECVETPLDIEGETLLDLIAQMAPDDWHEIALNWDWAAGITELEWLATDRSCDRATALYILCMGWPGDVAIGKPRPHAGFVRDVAARLEGGFYQRAEFGLALSVRQQVAFQQQLAMARGTGESPWRIPAELLAHQSMRTPAPKYAVTGGRAHYHYGYWLERVAPLKR